MRGNVSAGIPLANMAVNQKVIVTSLVLVTGHKHVEQVGKITSIGQVCSILKILMLFLFYWFLQIMVRFHCSKKR